MTDLQKMDSLEACESIIERGIGTFVEVGTALARIRDNREWYRENYGTFENYCRERWGFKANYGYKMIAAAGVVASLGTSVHTTEAAIRPLTKIKDDDERREAWEEAVKTADGGITARHVAAVVERKTNGKTVRPKSKHVSRKTGNEIVLSVIGSLEVVPLALSRVGNAEISDELLGELNRAKTAAWSACNSFVKERSHEG